MLLNDVQPDKRLAYLLGVQVERHVFRGMSRTAVRITVLGATVLLLLGGWGLFGMLWR